jgi:hypothetical protein
MGDMLLVESAILPLGMKAYAVARDTELNKLFRKIFSLPDPTELTQVLNATELAQVDDYVLTWFERWLKEQQGLPLPLRKVSCITVDEEEPCIKANVQQLFRLFISSR